MTLVPYWLHWNFGAVVIILYLIVYKRCSESVGCVVEVGGRRVNLKAICRRRHERVLKAAAIIHYCHKMAMSLIFTCKTNPVTTIPLIHTYTHHICFKGFKKKCASKIFTQTSNSAMCSINASHNQLILKDDNSLTGTNRISMVVSQHVHLHIGHLVYLHVVNHIIVHLHPFFLQKKVLLVPSKYTLGQTEEQGDSRRSRS